MRLLMVVDGEKTEKAGEKRCTRRHSKKRAKTFEWEVESEVVQMI